MMRVGLIGSLRARLWSFVHAWLNRRLHRRGYTLTTTGVGFIDAKSTVAAARREGVSICEYREAREDDPRKKGRRDFIIEQMRQAGVLGGVSRVCEIGAGTGQYLEKVLAIARPKLYEVYETDPGWRRFLQSEYGRNEAGCEVIAHVADGRTLASTASGSCDLVQAHAVFVYLPLLRTMEYLQECVRVCKPGGAIVFDCMYDTEMTMAAVSSWLAGPYRFPVVIPRKLLDEFAAANGLDWVSSFSTIYGGSTADYAIWRKAKSR